MREVETIENPAVAAAALEPVRSRLLAELVQPASAAGVARRLGLARQKVNYHLRALEAHGLVQTAGERRWGGLTERLLVASAASYLVSPTALGPAASDPARSAERGADRLSAAYAIALAGRIVRELSGLLRGAEAAGKRLASLSLETEISFRSPAERAAFSRELAEAVAALAARYHDPMAREARPHRLVIVAHPLPAPVSEVTNAPTPPTEEAPCQ